MVVISFLSADVSEGKFGLGIDINIACLDVLRTSPLPLIWSYSPAWTLFKSHHILTLWYSFITVLQNRYHGEPNWT
jgi:hypothetical protein